MTERPDERADASTEGLAPHPGDAADAAGRPAGTQLGARVGILAGLTIGAYGLAFAMSLTTVSAVPPS